MRARPRCERGAHPPAERDDEHERADDRQQRRRELDVVPRADSAEPEQDSGGRLPDHVRNETDRRDRGCRRADRRCESADADDQHAAGDSENDREPERALCERAQLARLVPFPVAHAIRDRDSELAEEPREDRHREDGEHERAAALGLEEATLEDDEEQRERRREPAEEQDLHDVRAGLAGLRDLLRPHQLGIDRRRRRRGGLVRGRVRRERDGRRPERSHARKLMARPGAQPRSRRVVSREPRNGASL